VRLKIVPQDLRKTQRRYVERIYPRRRSKRPDGGAEGESRSSGLMHTFYLATSTLVPTGLAFLVIGILFRGYDWLPSMFSWRRMMTASRVHAEQLRANGLTADADRVDARLDDQQARLVRYGHLLMVVGVLLVLGGLLRAVLAT